MTAAEVVGAIDPSAEILTKRELADRLKVSLRKVEYLRLPSLDLGYRSKRYIWGEVLEHVRQLRNGR